MKEKPILKNPRHLDTVHSSQFTSHRSKFQTTVHCSLNPNHGSKFTIHKAHTTNLAPQSAIHRSQVNSPGFTSPLTSQAPPVLNLKSQTKIIQ